MRRLTDFAIMFLVCESAMIVIAIVCTLLVA